MKEAIEKANEFLKLQGSAALKKSRGFGGGKAVVGYRPQYLVDAVNAGLGAENWRYEIAAYDLTPGEKVFTAWVMLRLFVRIPQTGEWIQKAEHFGQAQSPATPGDALKGATTDALGKAFSILSIGRDAYNGSLSMDKGEGWQSSRASKNQEAPSVTAEPVDKAESPAPSGLPEIPGVSFETRDGRLVAVGETYAMREELKKAGFRYESGTKTWIGACMT